MRGPGARGEVGPGAPRGVEKKMPGVKKEGGSPSLFRVIGGLDRV